MNALTNCIPNLEILNQIALVLPTEMMQFAKDIGQFDFAMLVIKIVAESKLMTVQQAMDSIFGEGTYNLFKSEIYEILVSK